MQPAPSPKPRYLIELESAVGRTWERIADAATATAQERETIQAALGGRGLVPADCSFVVFGSLARGELTPKSDVDWTLLVDGQADPQHMPMAQAIARALQVLERKEPGPTATFGGLTFSHDLIHQIGGQDDTNRNTTRRILLLLESMEIGRVGVRDRVMRGLLRRYLDEDRGYHALHDWRIRAPHFLLNDIVRFWRTMAVDYAAKRRDRNWDGWAIRNFKLRMSRKLIFAAGLAMCMSCDLGTDALRAAASSKDSSEVYAALQDQLMRFANRPPLESIAAFGAELGAEKVVGELFDAYDQFLGVLADTQQRDRLEKIPHDEAADDPIFTTSREIGRAFQTALTKLFFETNPALTRATQRYGVF